METTADQIKRISISLDRLRQNFIVSMREFEPHPSGDGDNVVGDVSDDGEDLEEVIVDGNIEEDDDEAGKGKEDELDEAKDNKEKTNKKNKKKKKKNVPPRLEDYDIDDPFIDDSEVTAAYESVFDLMLKGRDNDGDDHLDDGESDEMVLVREKSTRTMKRQLLPTDFYVYRGPIEVEVVEKYPRVCYQLTFITTNRREFDEKPKKKKSKKKNAKKASKPVANGAPKSEEPNEGAPEEKPVKAQAKKKRLRDEPSSSLPKSPKKPKQEQISLTERLSKLEAELEEKMVDDNEKPIDIGEDEEQKQNVRKFYDIEKEVVRLEIEDAFARLQETAVKIPQYDPNRFPTLLRSPLERFIICCLKRDDGYLMEGEECLQRVSAIVPYSTAALKKLLLRKIFPLMIESLGQVKPEIIRAKIREEIRVVLASESGAVDTTKSAETTGSEAKPEDAPVDSKKPLKKRLSDSIKELVFEYLKCASERALLLKAVRVNSVELSQGEPPKKINIPSSISETSMRRNAYKELLSLWDGCKSDWTMTTGELSRECSNWKKRYERVLLKEHDVDIEKFLVIVERKPASNNTVGEGENTIVVVDSQPHPGSNGNGTLTPVALETKTNLASILNDTESGTINNPDTIASGPVSEPPVFTVVPITTSSDDEQVMQE